MNKPKLFEFASLKVTLKMWLSQFVAGLISFIVWLIGWFIALSSGNEWIALVSLVVAIIIYVVFGLFMSGWLSRIWWKWK